MTELGQLTFAVLLVTCTGLEMGHPISARMLMLNLGLSAGAFEKQWLFPASVAEPIKQNDSASILLREPA